MRTDSAKQVQYFSEQIGKELAKGDKADFGKLLDAFISKSAFQESLNKADEMRHRLDIQTELRTNLQGKLKTYGGAWAWTHAVTSLGIGIGASALGFAGSPAATPVSSLAQATNTVMGVHSEEKSGRRESFGFEGEELKRFQNDSKEDERAKSSKIAELQQTANKVASAAHDAAAGMLR